MVKKKSSSEHEKDQKQTNETLNQEDNTAVNIEPASETTDKQTESSEQKVSEKTEKEVSAEEKLAEMTDKYLRLSAEFDNYRKRTLREKIELTKTAGEDILRNIIPVIDDFERALKQVESTQDCAAVKSGIDLIYNKFLSFLKQQGIKEIEAVNKEFDVDLHEAITKIPAPDENMRGKVVDVVEKGYFLNDKVMRFSKVVVGE